MFEGHEGQTQRPGPRNRSSRRGAPLVAVIVGGVAVVALAVGVALWQPWRHVTSESAPAGAGSATGSAAPDTAAPASQPITRPTIRWILSHDELTQGVDVADESGFRLGLLPEPSDGLLLTYLDSTESADFPTAYRPTDSVVTIALDASDGHVRWRASRAYCPGEKSGDLLVCVAGIGTSQAKIELRDPSTGEVRRSGDTMRIDAVRTAGDSIYAIGCEAGAQGFAVTRLAPDTTQRWSRDDPTARPARCDVLDASESGLILELRQEADPELRVMVFAAADGAPTDLGQEAFPRRWAGNGELLVQRYTPGRTSVQSLNREKLDGTTLWSVPESWIDTEPRCHATAPDSAAILVSPNDSSLQAVDLATGRVMWAGEDLDLCAAGFDADGAALFAANSDGSYDLELVNAADGSVDWRVPLDPRVRGGLLTDWGVVLPAEDTTIALDRTSGAELWRMPAGSTIQEVAAVGPGLLVATTDGIALIGES